MMKEHRIEYGADLEQEVTTVSAGLIAAGCTIRDVRPLFHDDDDVQSCYGYSIVYEDAPFSPLSGVLPPRRHES